MTGNLLIRNVRPMGSAAADILIRNGRIARIEPGLSADGVATEDGGGRIVIPGLIEAHTHLDKSLLGMDWYRNEVGPLLIDKIDNERQAKIDLGIEPHRQSMRQALVSAAYGSTHIRSHVDIDTVHGVAGVEGIMRTREALRDVIDIELVAFPQSGLLARPGTLELMEKALEMGVEIVGGVNRLGMGTLDRRANGTPFGARR